MVNLMEQFFVILGIIVVVALTPLWVPLLSVILSLI